MVKPTLKPSNGSNRAHLSPSSHFDGVLDADETLGVVLLLDARRLQQEHERAGRAVHDRHFGRGQVDIGVVDAQAGHGRQQVLDGLDLAAAAAISAGAQAGLADQVGLRRDLDRRGRSRCDGTRCRVSRRSRTQGHVDLFAAMQPDAGGADDVLEGALLEHWSSVRPTGDAKILTREDTTGLGAGPCRKPALTLHATLPRPVIGSMEPVRPAGRPSTADRPKERRPAGAWPDGVRTATGTTSGQSAWRRRNAGISR